MTGPRFPKIFLSCSFDAGDRALFEWFRRLAEALEFEVLSGDEPSVESLQATIRGRLEHSQGLVAILSRRSKVAGTEEWLPPTWVHDELSIALTLGKPTIVFAEEAVRVEGIVPLEVKFERFDRMSIGASAPTLVRYLITLRNVISPPNGTPAELATVRALCEELSGIAARLSSVQETLEASGFNFSILTARSTGRFYVLPQELQDAVTGAYRSVAAVDSVLEEISEVRAGLRSTVRGVLLSDFSLPPLPADHAIRTKLAGRVESAREKVGTAWIALYRLGYPERIEELQTQVAAMPPGPQKDAIQILLEFLSGEKDSA